MEAKPCGQAGRAKIGTPLGLFWSALAFNDTYKPYRELRAALLAGRSEIVAGTVEDFRPVHPGAVYLEAGMRS